MKMVATLILGSGLSISTFASSINNSDVKRFINYADLCEHFLGELGDTLSFQEQKRVVASANKYCDKAKQQYNAITKKYQDDAEIMRLVSEYSDTLSDEYTK
jgi:hypothetical protein